jgi:RecJ-like exonuclease
MENVKKILIAYDKWYAKNVNFAESSEESVERFLKEEQINILPKEEAPSVAHNKDKEKVCPFCHTKGEIRSYDYCHKCKKYV